MTDSNVVHLGTKMTFRLRPGFMLFRSRDELDLWQGGGELARGIRPRAEGGETVELNALERAELGDKIGMFEPQCASARECYSDVKPIFADGQDKPSVMTVADLEGSRARGAGRVTVKSTGEHL
jgi:hypothetical protein